MKPSNEGVVKNEIKTNTNEIKANTNEIKYKWYVEISGPNYGEEWFDDLSNAAECAIDWWNGLSKYNDVRKRTSISVALLSSDMEVSDEDYDSDEWWLNVDTSYGYDEVPITISSDWLAALRRAGVEDLWQDIVRLQAENFSL